MFHRLFALAALTACSESTLGTEDATDKASASFCAAHPTHWRCATQGTADCTVTALDVPDIGAINGASLVTATVQNVGTGAGTCETSIDVSSDIGGSWVDATMTVSAYLAQGATTTVTATPWAGTSGAVNEVVIDACSDGENDPNGANACLSHEDIAEPTSQSQFDCAVTEVLVPDPDLTDGGVVEITIENQGSAGTYCEIGGRILTGDGGTYDGDGGYEEDYGSIFVSWMWLDAGSSYLWTYDIGAQVAYQVSGCNGSPYCFEMDDAVNVFLFADMCAFAEGQDPYDVRYDQEGAGPDGNADNACLCAESGNVPAIYDGYTNLADYAYPLPGCGQ